MKFAIVKEYLSAFSAQQPDVIVGVSETLSEAVEVAIKAFIADHPEQSANTIELASSATSTNKIKCQQYVLQIHDREQVMGYRGQAGYFSIVNAGADNVFSRLLKWIPTHTEVEAHSGATPMIVSAVRYTGVPEDYFIIETETAPAEWPVDEIDCAVSRANAVIALVMIFLSSKDKARPLDSTLSDAIWSVTGDVALIQKLAYHYNNEAVDNAARCASSGLTAVSMFLNEQQGQPADYILSDCLELVVTQLMEIRKLSYQEREQQRQLRAA